MSASFPWCANSWRVPSSSRMPLDFDLSGMLRRWSRARPAHPALIEPRNGRGSPAWRQVSFGEFDAKVDRYAHGLTAAGVRRADRVLYLVRPSTESLAAVFALSRIGAVPVGIDPGMGLKAMLRCVAHIRPRIVIAVPSIHALRMFARRAFASSEVFITSSRGRGWAGRSLAQCLSTNTTPYPDGEATELDECVIVFTSGSTGPAAPVSITNRMILHRIRVIHDVCGWRDGMKVVVCFPSQAPSVVANGLTAILPDMDFARPALARPERIVDAVAAHGAEAAFAAPVVWMNLAQYCQARNVTLPTLREVVTAGAPVMRDLHDRLREILHPEARLHTPYGSTEALPVSTIDSTRLGDTWQQTLRGYGTCVGEPVPGVRVSVIRITEGPIADWSDDLCVRAGEIGELVVGGPVVSPAYVDLPASNALSKIHHGNDILHRMGDLGRVDARGRVWFCGRKSDRFETPAGVLMPVLGENILNEHPKVLRVAIVGVGPLQDRIPVCCVEMKRGEKFTPAIEAELDALTRGSAWEGVVKRFLQHPGFPTDTRHNSKLRRDEIARWASRKLRSHLAPKV